MGQGLSVILDALNPGTAAGFLFLSALISYLLGTCNGAVLVSRFFLGDDVRQHGSGNGGLTNFNRTYGGKKGHKLTLVVIATDMLKVVISVALSWLLFSVVMPSDTIPMFVTFWAGIFCVIGHVFPCTLHFHGGKGILCGGTLALLVDWRVALFAWGIFILGALITHWVSLGSILAGATFGISSAICFPTPSIAIPALLAGGLIVWKHRGNFKRIIHGEEPKLSFHRKKAGP